MSRCGWGAQATGCDAHRVVLAGERIATATAVWAMGVIAAPAASWLETGQDRAGRAVAGPDVALPADPRILAIDDIAAVPAPRGPAPGNAPAAKQPGRHVAAAFRALVSAGSAPIGRGAAVVDRGRPRFAGRPAWPFGAIAQVWFLIGWKNRRAVGATWASSHLTHDRGARLITSAAQRSVGPAGRACHGGRQRGSRSAA